MTRATARQLAAMDLYANLMEEAKARLVSIQTVVNERKFPAQIIREFAYLQLRMLCELIALGCLVAHGDIKATQTKKLREEHKAGKIVAALETLHPNFYPQPYAQTVVPGGFQLAPLQKSFLTKREMLILHGRCGDYLHRGSLDRLLSSSVAPAKQRGFSDIVTWTKDVDNLLSFHALALFDEDIRFVCMLRNADDGGRVQVLFIERQHEPPKSPRSSHG